MGSTMKPTIFNDSVAAALRNWHRTAKKHIKQSRHSTPATPMSSRPATPSHHASPIHLLRHYRPSEADSAHTSPRPSNYDADNWETDSPSPGRFHGGAVDASNHHIELSHLDKETVAHHDAGSSEVAPLPPREQHQISIGSSKDFSFDKR